MERGWNWCPFGIQMKKVLGLNISLLETVLFVEKNSNSGLGSKWGWEPDFEDAKRTVHWDNSGSLVNFPSSRFYLSSYCRSPSQDG